MSEQKEKEKRWLDEIYMLAENEAWLNEQAQKGLILKSFDTRYVTFEKGQPQEYIYKIAVLDEEYSENQINSIEKQGFTFLAKFKEYHVFCIECKDTTEIEFDNQMVKFIGKWFDEQIKNQLNFIVFFITFISLCFIVARCTGLIYGEILIDFLFKISTLEFSLYGIITSLIFIKIINEVVVLKKLKKLFMNNYKYYKARCKIKSKTVRSVNTYFLIFIMLLVPTSVSLYLNHVYNVEEVPVYEISDSIPIVTMEQLLEESVNSYDVIIPEEEKKDDYVIMLSNLLAPKQYYSWQTYLNEGKYGVLQINYYESISKILTKISAKELIYDAVNKRHRDKIKKLESTYFDEVYVYEDFYNIDVCVRKNKKVMCIEYDGTIKPTAEKFLEEMAEVL